MKTKDVISAFGSVATVAIQLGISRMSVYQWKEEPPLLRQYQLREMRPDLFRKPKSKKSA